MCIRDRYTHYQMRFLLFIAFFALISCVFMEGNPESSVLSKYFHKKMCYCTKAQSGLCTSLKCCDVFKYVPYKIVIKMCKYGDCKFVTTYDEEEEHIGGGSEKESGVSI
eukprot:TRINITY_DN418_c0_g1_i20.p2 TRINITY_DN418_c0_g1~~TRINITY_DN418_c0_g1_i20.p2  ORF type:complete len:109 (+),score=38.09 TRINITY_DN418_c0_g1_i20:77-403(+)